MPKFVFLTLCIIFSLVLKAQNASISGKITNNDQPLAYVSVGIAEIKKGATSDEKGMFVIENVPVGRYFIQCSSIGFTKMGVWVNTEAGKKSIVNFELKSLHSDLDELTISGTMKEVSRLNSPVPVEVYGQKFFLKNPSNSLFESLQMINGVQPTLNCNVCNTGDIHINGLEGPYTLVLIDGMPIISALSTVYGLSGIPNSLIERVEIVKGPAASLYGSEAVGGLINVITKNPDKAPRLSVDYFGSSYLENNLDLSYVKRAGKLSFLMSGNYFNFNNRVDLNQDNFTDITLQNRISVFTKMQYNRKEKLSSNLAVRYYYEDRFGGELQWNKSFRGGDSVYGESIYTKRFELLGSHPFTLLNQHLKFQLSYNIHDQNSAYGKNLFNAVQQTSFNQLLWDKKINLRNDALIGIALKYTRYDDNTPATATLQQNFLPGVFIQDEITIDSKQTLLLGSRLDYYKAHGFIYSPRANYKLTINRNNTIRLSAGNGFRVVNIFTEDHAALTGARQVIITEKIKPEQSWNINLQYSRYLNFKKGFIGLDAAMFYTYFSNKIVGNFDKDPNKIFYDNLAEHAVSKGVTINLDAAFTFPLKVNAGITLMQVYTVMRDSIGILKNVQQIHAPKFSGTFQVTYTFKKQGISIDYTGQVYGPMRLPVLPGDYRPAYSPWFTIQNLQITKVLPKGFEVYGGVKNIWNYLPKNPLMRPFDPFDKKVNDVVNNPNNYTFDTEYNYTSLYAIRGFIGVRYKIR